MKKILCFCLALLMIVPCLIGLVSAKDYTVDTFENEEAKLENMTIVAVSENQNMELYFDEFSGEIAIKNKATGEIILSNPYDVGSLKLKPDIAGQYLSQLYLNFVKIQTNESLTYYSYNDCVVYGDQIKIVSYTKDGVVINYTLGDARSELLLPLKISVTDFEALLEQIEDPAAKNRVLNGYTKYDPYEKKADGTYKHSEGKRKSWIEKYPICETIPIYVLKTEYFNNDGEKKIISDNIAKYTEYTLDQLRADYEKVKDETDDFTMEVKPVFKFNVYYKIDNAGFKAELDAASFEYDKDLYYLTSVSLLPYLGAAKRADTGYTFLPDGSGALMRFEDIVANKKFDLHTVTLYGTDYSLYQISNKNVENSTMPVFGLVNSTAVNGKGYFAIIENGDALASVTSNHTAYYHHIYPSFKLTATDQYDLADAFSSGSSSSTPVNVRADKPYEGKCTIKYTMLSDNEASGLEEASYVGMANVYRDYLEKKGVIDALKAEELSDFTRIFIEVFGSVEVDDKVLSFPVKVQKPLTTFKDVEKIYGELKDEGIGNMTFLLKGFANGGLKSTYPTSIKWQSVLGGKNDLISLLNFAKGEKDLVIAPDVDFNYSQGVEAFSGFDYKKDGVRTLDNRYSTKREYIASTQTFERTGGVVISSASFALAYEKFYASASQYEIKYLATRTLGSSLNSDLDRKNFYDREASKGNIVNMLGLLTNDKTSNYGLILEAGNSYTVKYADAIVAASLDSSRFVIESEAVPFYGMVFHASIEFAGNAINMDGDSDYMFLKALENGASLYYTLAMQNAEFLKFDPVYNRYYSLNYETLKDNIIAQYKEYNKLMADKQDKYIYDHEFMNFEYGYNVVRTGSDVGINNSAVVLVLYGDKAGTQGEGFILNYNAYRVTVTEANGTAHVIEPFSYLEITSEQLWK